MRISATTFEATDWNTVDATEHAGATGVARWRTKHAGEIRIRMVEYSVGYVADHWCEKGHVVLCLEGELDTELADGRTFHLTAGMSYQVADGAAPHRSASRPGTRLFILD